MSKTSFQEQLLAELLGVERAFRYTGRIARVIRKKDGGWNQLAITGVLLSQEDQDYEGGEWERIDCDVIIIPKAKFDIKQKGYRIGQVAMMLGTDDAWEAKNIKDEQS